MAKWIVESMVDGLTGETIGPCQDAELRALRKRTRELEQENEILRRAAAPFAKGGQALPACVSRVTAH